MATRRLRDRGLRATRPRRLVWERLRRLGGHRSAEELHAGFRDEGEPISRMTVYNVLADLERVGLVMRADVGPGRSLWEAGDEWHHHFVCRACGSIHDVPCAHGSKPCLDAGFTGGEVEEAQIIFRGLCNACRSRSG